MDRQVLTETLIQEQKKEVIDIKKQLCFSYLRHFYLHYYYSFSATKATARIF